MGQKVIAGTGHRPSSIGGYSLPNPTYNFVCQQTEKILLKEKPDKVISGMALGFDMWLANIALRLSIPLVAAVPCIGQERLWNQQSQRAYNILLNKASEVNIVSEGNYTAQKMQIRNEWMVDNSNILIAVWNGSSGGTSNCINYAKSKNKEIIFINPKKP